VSDPRFPGAGWRPTHSQQLLLRGALWKGEPALEAWRQWREREVLEEVEPASQRLVGLLYRNLEAHGVEHRSMRKLKGVYMHTWYKNRTVLRGSVPPLRALREGGIPTLVLKGVSLCEIYYRDWGVRGMEDLDVLVPPDRAYDAIAALRGIGAQPATLRIEETVPLRNAGPFEHPDGWDVDLHWYSLFRSASDESMWEQAVPLEVSGEQTLAPGPTHMLLHVCTHGADYNETAPIRWLSDAYVVLESGQVDWELFVREARARLLTVVLASSLRHLVEVMHAEVPAEVISELEAVRAPRFERAGFRATAQPFSPRRTVLMLWERYRRMRALRPPGPKPAGLFRSFYGYLSLQWGVKNRREFARHVLRRLSSSRSAA
jgi:Uncharacterised nucleotidyltransferase